MHARAGLTLQSERISFTVSLATAWQNFRAHFSKSDPQAIFLREGPHDHGISIQQKLPLTAVRHLQGFGSPPAQFQHRAIAARIGSTDGPGSQQIPYVEVTAIAGVVSQLLGQIPIEVLGVGATNDLRLTVWQHDLYFQLDVDIALSFKFEIGQNRGILHWASHPMICESIQAHDPGRNRRGKVFFPKMGRAEHTPTSECPGQTSH